LIKETLGSLSDLNYSLIFFISPKKINKCIPYIKHYFKGRKILICREISKFYEEYLRFNVDQLDLFAKDLKGELTVVLSEKKLDKKKLLILSESDKRIIEKIINKLSTKEITDLIGQTSKVPKKEIYNYCVKLKNEK
jgi:16S rRNA (cytidine1402-2'-O)-methyltransferase